jgi:glycerol-3-phosphate O-acyltransferase / dihydroxyacetone phosphate acyltransferase
MWLLPLLDRVSTFAAKTYYRVTVAGERVPPEGPALLVANHPNALLDPALVAAAARRPVRFLAKEPLLRDRAVGWLVRGVGAIPVYRAQDDPATVGRNEGSFRAAHEALNGGAAVGIFPEGISHDLPAMAPLKTGAARIALGAARRLGGPFPIVPLGLSFRAKARFRSEALVLVGSPVEWSDLVRPDYGTAEVRELTRRIAAALHDQTLNLAAWEDAPLVEWAAEIYSAHFGDARDAPARAAVEREATRILVRERERGSGEWEGLAREVRRHARSLQRLGLRPPDLESAPSAGTAARWTIRNVGMLLTTAPLGLAGSILFYLPYRATGFLVDRLNITPDARSTYRTLGGALLFTLWIMMLATVVGVVARSGWAAAAAVVVLPFLALFALNFRDRWTYARDRARRFLLLRSRERWRRELEARQRRIAERLHEVRASADAGAAVPADL